MSPSAAATLALCLSGALLMQVAAAARVAPTAADPKRHLLYPGGNSGRRLRGTVLHRADAMVSNGGAAGSSSAAIGAKTLSTATSTNAAGVSAAASTNWDFDKSDDDVSTPSAAAPRRLGMPADAPDFPASAYPDANGRRRLSGHVLSDDAAMVSNGAAAGSSSAALGAKALSTATSTNAAGVSAAASTNWDFDKDGDMSTPSAAAPRRLGDAPEFDASAYPDANGRRRLQGPAVPTSSAGKSNGAAEGSSSAAVGAKTLSSATSTNSAGIKAAASTSWTFDKEDQPNAPRRLGIGMPSQDPSFPAADWPSAGNRRLLLTI